MRLTPNPSLRRTLSICLLGGAAALCLDAAAAPALVRNLSASNAAVAQQKALVAEARNQARDTRSAGEIFANAYRAYPPSCLADGLPIGGYATSKAIDVVQGQMLLLGDPAECLPGGNAAECNYQETDTITVWRQDCSGGKSVTLLEIDRPSTASTTLYPTLPLITVTQGANSEVPVRVASDPNSFFSTNYANSPLKTSDVFVLENYYSGTSSQFDYNKTFVLKTDNQDSHGTPLLFTLGDYAPPASPARLEISGYMSTNWSNPNQSGEGIVLQVYDNGDHQSRTLSFAWFTYDKNGQPFWLFGLTSVPIGQTQITAPTYYLQGGAFNPSAAAGTVPSKGWGFVTFTFPDCGHMNIAYNSSGNPPAPVPSGQGSSLYTRVADVNGLVCQ